MPIVVRRQHLHNRIAELETQLGMETSETPTPRRSGLIRLRTRPVQLEKGELLTKSLMVVQRPETLLGLPENERTQVGAVAKAIQAGSTWTKPGTPTQRLRNMRPLSAAVVAQRAAQALGPSSSVTPVEIELAMRTQGIDWIEPFAPGQPLVPYYGYSRTPRSMDYRTGRNVTTQTREDRIPYSTLLQLWKSYDVAQICTRHAINDLRSMRLRFEPMEGFEDNPVKEIAAAKKFLRRPDGKRTFRNFLAQNALDLWRFDAAPIYRQRDRAGRVTKLKNISGPTIAPMLDYHGDTPEGDAPAYQQFIQGIPWDWLKEEDLIFEPMWPETESPYGTPPLETVLINASTDLRLQTYFLQFFTSGQVPEAFAIAPEGQDGPDDLADWQEQYDDWTYGDQSERWGLRWLPNGTELEFYKPQQFDPDVAEYVMRRTVAAFMMVPQDLGFTEDVNRATGDTQMDIQFRVNTLPHCSYYEDIFDSVLQDDLDLPVQVRFDTGREKEDRLMEAQAHQIYVSIGAESPDEVREKVLGYAINPEEKVPRFFDSARLGPMPLEYLLSVSGDVDPLTGAPRPGTVARREFVMVGAQGPDPLAGEGGTQYDDESGGGGGEGPKGAPASARRAKVYEDVRQTGQPSASSSETKPALNSGPKQGPSGGGQGGKPDGAPGYGNRRLEQTRKEATAGITVATGIAGVHMDDDDDDEELADLNRWRAKSRKGIAGGKSPRHFVDSSIGESVYERVWSSLEKATTRDEVDEAFSKAFLTENRARSFARDAAAPPRPFSGLALRAVDTGRALMIQRAKVDNDPAAGTWEFPGGHVDEGETTRSGAEREFAEECGFDLPANADPVGEWDSYNGCYRGHVYEVPVEADVDLRGRDSVANPDNLDQDYFEAMAWWDPAQLSNHPGVRPELRADCAAVQHALQASVLKAGGADPKVLGGKTSTAIRTKSLSTTRP